MAFSSISAHIVSAEENIKLQGHELWCSMKSALTSSEVPMTIRRSANGKSVRYLKKCCGSSSPKNTMSGLTTPLHVGHFGTVPLITSGWWDAQDAELLSPDYFLSLCFPCINNKNKLLLQNNQRLEWYLKKPNTQMLTSVNFLTPEFWILCFVWLKLPSVSFLSNDRPTVSLTVNLYCSINWLLSKTLELSFNCCKHPSPHLSGKRTIRADIKRNCIQEN